MYMRPFDARVSKCGHAEIGVGWGEQRRRGVVSFPKRPFNQSFTYTNFGLHPAHPRIIPWRHIIHTIYNINLRNHVTFGDGSIYTVMFQGGCVQISYNEVIEPSTNGRGVIMGAKTTINQHLWYNTEISSRKLYRGNCTFFALQWF